MYEDLGDEEISMKKVATLLVKEGSLYELYGKAAMVLMHPKILRNMGTCFLLNLEGYGDGRSELGDMRISLKEGSFP